MLERFAAFIILCAPLVTYSLDPMGFARPFLYVYFANVGIQLIAMGVFCRFLWNRWKVVGV